MLSSPIKYCGIMVFKNHSALPINKNNMAQVVTGIGLRNYAKEDKDCCKDVVQAEGKRVESWPKEDPPPPAWRCECPRDPQPPNYDPYRIKVPDVMVPPLPPSNARECLHCAAGEFYGYPEYRQATTPTEGVTDLFYNSPSIRDYWQPQPERTNETISKLGYHGRSKLKYAFHEPWKPLDRMTLLEQAEREESGQGDEKPSINMDEEQLSK